MQKNPKLPIATAVLDILPNPVLIKNDSLEYVWINAAFEELFSISRNDVIGKLDKDLFPDRQVAQCNGGDLRVLHDGEIDESVETVYGPSGLPKETITRKSKLTVDNDQVYLVGVMHDITEVTRANEALVISESKLQEKAQELALLASTDALTGCSNRRALMNTGLTISENQFKSAALLLVDLDKFKAINDNYGHEIGDKTLKHFADETRTLLAPGDKFYRYGGEEFVLLLDVKTREEAIKKAEAIRKHIAKSPLNVDGTSINISASIGMVFKEKGDTHKLEQLLQTADQCLYKAKDAGRDRIEIAAA